MEKWCPSTPVYIHTYTYIYVHIDIYIHMLPPTRPPPPPPASRTSKQFQLAQVLDSSIPWLIGIVFFIHDELQAPQQNCVALQAECAALSLKRLSFSRAVLLKTKVLQLQKCVTVPMKSILESQSVVLSLNKRENILEESSRHRSRKERVFRDCTALLIPLSLFEMSGRMHLPKIGFFGTLQHS